MKNFVAALTVRFVDRLSRPARTAASAIGQIERAQKMAARAGVEWSKGMEKLDSRLNRLAAGSLAVDGIARAGQAVIRPLTEATRTTIGYREQLASIADTANLTTDQISNLERAIGRTSAASGRGPVAIAEAAAIYAAAGLSVDVTERLLGTTAKVAVGARVSFADAGNAAVAFAQNLAVVPRDMEAAFDAAHLAGQRGRFELQAMASAFPVVGAAAQRRGMTGKSAVAEISAALQIVRRQSADDSSAATGVRDLLNRFDSNETRNNFEKFGIDVVAAVARQRAQGASVIDAVLNVTREAEAKGAGLNQLFTEQDSQNAVGALLAFRSEFTSIRTDAELAAGVVERSFKRMRVTDAEKLKSYTANMERLGISVGTILAPAVGVAAGVLGRLAGWMSRTAESGGLLGKVAVYAVAGMAGIAVGAGAIGHAVIGILGPLFILNTLIGPGGLGGAAVRGGLATVVGMLGRVRLAAIGVNLAFLGNPIVLAIAAVVAVAVIAAVLIRRNWGTVGPWLAGVWRGIAGATQRGINLARGYVMNFTPMGILIRNWGPISNFFGAVWGAAKAVTGLMFDGIKYLVLRFTPMGFIIRNWGPITGFLTTLWNGARTVVDAGLTAIRNAIATFGPLNAFKSAFAGVWSWLGELPGRMLNAGADAVRGFTRGVQGQRTAVQAATAGIGGAAETGVRDRLEIRSPSRVFMALGDYAMAGLAIGLERGSRGPLGTMAAVSAALATTAPGAAGAASFGSGGPSGPAAATASAGTVTIAKLEQHFHLPAGSPDVREIARELKRLGDQGVRRALSDAVAS